jgi:hypothetical protein
MVDPLASGTYPRDASLSGSMNAPRFGVRIKAESCPISACGTPRAVVDRAKESMPIVNNVSPREPPESAVYRVVAQRPQNTVAHIYAIANVPAIPCRRPNAMIGRTTSQERVPSAISVTHSGVSAIFDNSSEENILNVNTILPHYSRWVRV